MQLRGVWADECGVIPETACNERVAEPKRLGSVMNERQINEFFGDSVSRLSAGSMTNDVPRGFR